MLAEQYIKGIQQDICAFQAADLADISNYFPIIPCFFRQAQLFSRHSLVYFPEHTKVNAIWHNSYPSFPELGNVAFQFPAHRDEPVSLANCLSVIMPDQWEFVGIINLKIVLQIINKRNAIFPGHAICHDAINGVCSSDYSIILPLADNFFHFIPKAVEAPPPKWPDNVPYAIFFCSKIFMLDCVRAEEVDFMVLDKRLE